MSAVGQLVSKDFDDIIRKIHCFAGPQLHDNAGGTPIYLHSSYSIATSSSLLSSCLTSNDGTKTTNVRLKLRLTLNHSQDAFEQVSLG